MRKEPYTIDSIIHVTKRGARGVDIVRDDADRRRFVKSLFYLNDVHSDPYWHEITAELSAFERPKHWSEREPLVHILAWTLLSNHFHLLLQEIQKGGTAKFMQRLGGSMTMCFNQKYKERGSIFQGAYHARIVGKDAHMNYLAFYILIKNVFEMYPGGLTVATVHFDDAWEGAKKYPFSSFNGLVSGKHSPIMDDVDGLLAEIIGRGDTFKKEAKELIAAHITSRGEDFKELMLESW
jgi:hypothetical protein